MFSRQKGKNMSREVRRVPAEWEHPMEERYGKSAHKPLHQGYPEAKAEFEDKQQKEGLQEALDYFGVAPNQEDYMPEWPDEERTHYQMYETCSEGTPISEPMETPEELARWLADTGASSFANMTATYEQWLATCQGAWAPSMVMAGGKLMSGVEAFSK